MVHGGRLRWLQAFDRPAFGNDPPLRLPGGDEENLRRAGFRVTIGQSAVLHPNSMLRFDYFFGRWNLFYPPNQSSIQAGAAGASKRSLITKTRCTPAQPFDLLRHPDTLSIKQFVEPMRRRKTSNPQSDRASRALGRRMSAALRLRGTAPARPHVEM